MTPGPSPQMTGYLAAIFFATVFMFLLHLVEWRTASAMAARLPLRIQAARNSQTALGDRAGSTASNPDLYVLLFLMKSDRDLTLPGRSYCSASGSRAARQHREFDARRDSRS